MHAAYMMLYWVWSQLDVRPQKIEQITDTSHINPQSREPDPSSLKIKKYRGVW